MQLRKSVPATKAFQRFVQALDAGVPNLEDETRMRDLAYLSLARTYYSASVRFHEKGVLTIDASKISAAIGHWNQVNMAGEYWPTWTPRNVAPPPMASSLALISASVGQTAAMSRNKASL